MNSPYVIFSFLGFSAGPAEIFIILAVALILFGPKQVPALAKRCGKALAQCRRAANDFSRQLTNLDDAVENEEASIHPAEGQVAQEDKG